MKPRTISYLHEITLQLQANVSAITGMFTSSVTEACQLTHILRIAHKTLSNWVHRILKSERTLKLSDLHPKEIKLLPFSPEVNKPDGQAIVFTSSIFIEGIPVDLHLGLIGKIISSTSIQSHTYQAQVESVLLCMLFVTGLILHHPISTQFHAL